MGDDTVILSDISKVYGSINRQFVSQHRTAAPDWDLLLFLTPHDKSSMLKMPPFPGVCKVTFTDWCRSPVLRSAQRNQNKVASKNIVYRMSTFVSEEGILKFRIY